MVNPTDKLFRPLIFHSKKEHEIVDFERIAEEQNVECIDLLDAQLQELALCRRVALSSEQITEEIRWEQVGGKGSAYGNWIYYPWLFKAFRMLEEEEYIEVRTNRNRNKITAEQQAILNKKKVGVAGLSVGRSLALTLVSQRLLGSIILADLDHLELSNLNRLKAPISEYGLLKTVSAAREIALIDPYIKVECLHNGLQINDMDAFFGTEDTIDLFVEECDDLEVKLHSRVAARSKGIPVVMEASDRCLVDIERFDLEPNRPILHGIVDENDLKTVGSLKTFEEKLPLLSKLVDVNNLSEGMMRSVPEIGKTLRTWPQLASDVTYGSGVMAKIIQGIFLGTFTRSGRFYVDFDPNTLLLEE